MEPTRLAFVLSLVGLLSIPGGVRAQPGTGPEPRGVTGLPPTIPIFPLGDVTLFPGVTRRFHIFEPRYRAMVTDVREGNGIIGLVLLRPGFEADYAGRPPVYPIGCAGVITYIEDLPNGRFNIFLRGLVKFRIIGEDDSRPYRLARVEAMPESPDAVEHAAIRPRRTRLGELLQATIGSPPPSEPGFSPDISDEYLINAVAQHLRIEPSERQALLEREGLLARIDALIRLLEGQVGPR
jgi:Lon protease-like protein